MYRVMEYNRKKWGSVDGKTLDFEATECVLGEERRRAMGDTRAVGRG
jgi:hypothetical protein